MKKFISVVLLLTIIISCFSITSFAFCSHNFSYTAQQSYHYYDSVCHEVRIKYICTNCGSVVNIEEHKLTHSDSNRDGFCDYCRSGSGGSSGSSSSSNSSGDIFYVIGEILGFIISLPIYIVTLPFNIIAALFGF